MQSDYCKERRTEHLWILGLSLAAILGGCLLQPAQGGSLELPISILGFRWELPETCMSKRLIGISCPGCGLTRSFAAMAHGEVSAAIRLNPVGPVLFVLFLLQIPYRVVEYFGLADNLPLWQQCRNHMDMVVWVVLAGLLLAWLVRLMAPVFPVLPSLALPQ